VLTDLNVGIESSKNIESECSLSPSPSPRCISSKEQRNYLKCSLNNSLNQKQDIEISDNEDNDYKINESSFSPINNVHANTIER
jgi:hypothetical protein